MTYFRKMKQIEIAQRVLFTRKERYLIDRQKEFVLDSESDDQHDGAESAVNSDDENGPIRSVQWWDELRREKKLISGLLKDKPTFAKKSTVRLGSRATPQESISSVSASQYDTKEL